jgi:putative nucleotidyltransferase with HDIG domain
LKINSEYLKLLSLGLVIILQAYLFPNFVPAKISSHINDISYGYKYSLAKRNLGGLKIIGIVIDDYSLNKIPQRWPWRRCLYAKLVSILDKEKVNTLGIDTVFVGESEDKEDDASFVQSLKDASCRVVLAYYFDYQNSTAVLPIAGIQQAAYSLGMVNTPEDKDGKIRRLRAYVRFKDEVYYSFPLALACSFGKIEPQSIIPDMPLGKDKTFSISYLLKNKDILRLSFQDVLENLEQLKKQYGQSFLKGSLVLIYPEAEVIHDIHPTPLGRMAGGTLHLNGAADILLKRYTKEVDLLSYLLLIFSFMGIFFILASSGFVAGICLSLGIIFLNLWIWVFFNLGGITFNYARVVIFSLLFFTCGSFYKYAYFLAQLLKIKDKATLDPVRDIFTLRYFSYRLELEAKKIYLHKEPFLVFIRLAGLPDKLEGFSLEKTRNIWRKIKLAISVRKSLWALRSPEELIGYLVIPGSKIEIITSSIKQRLGLALKQEGLDLAIELKYLKFRKGSLEKAPQERLLESIGEDIEEKNRQLLALIESLNKEHARTKKAYFEIITSLVNALEARDKYTEGHSQRVCQYALELADRLGWSQEEKEKLKKAALLHDLGKIGIPDIILHKRSQLDKEEFEFIKKHSAIAVKILKPLEEFDQILSWILHHHERWDGSGYPDGLKGVSIPLASQILSLADVFDALATGRDYKVALSSKEAMGEIEKNKGTQFNPQLADIFIQVIKSTEKTP